ncbi:MAG TPA: hypothetical protein DCS31_08810 [Candidatus Competibacteraceae bacterium]|nr:hypothetical protein [Candidatus Competibacteraceae bacterium]
MGTLNAVQKTSGSGREGLEEIHDYNSNLEFSSKKHPKIARTCAFPALAYNHPVTAKSVIGGIGLPESKALSAPSCDIGAFFALLFRLWRAVRGIRKDGRFLRPVGQPRSVRHHQIGLWCRRSPILRRSTVMSAQLIPVVASEFGDQTVQTVDGRTLHNFLEVKSQFRDWISNRIEEYGFESGKDFRDFFSESTGGRPTKEYTLTLNMAKELAMVERNAKGKQARQYFIECEQRLLNETKPAPSLDLATLSTHALRELATEIEKNAALQSRVIVMQPKADFFDHVVGSETLFDRDEAAKMLRTGPRRLWDALREWQVVQAGGQPYQKYYDLGYFRLVPTLIDKGSYKVPYQQVMITAKGLTWLKALMDSHVMPSKALTVVGGAV